ncbi:hypothetical protein MKW98_025427 [Papaver atlanticum]|uniref:indole-3-pyruvate monooxygenase n=1 Tax=Papaver atlanticum TaxID=357466 RepID=A0AAD4XD19_9MAGN|nr:hypothetical protein MKW98_025427 [Papaver atlanticum]
MTTEIKRVWVSQPVIIGGGPSGLAVAACLKKKGLPSLILERENCAASLWRNRTYDRLKLHLPKNFCQLPYMEFPPDFPSYPTKEQYIEYLDAYVKHFSIEPIYEEHVQIAEYDSAMGFWLVKTNNAEFVCRWLIVATGENADPVIPEIDGISDFQGQVLHTSLYKNGDEFEGDKVLVLGCGNSGMEISLDLCNCGAQVSIVVRDTLHILPRDILGRSTFGISMCLLKWFPIWLVDQFLLFCSRLILQDVRQLGFKRPELGPLELKIKTGKTPVLDVGTLAKIRTGQIMVVPGVKRFTNKGVEFVDGRVDEFDSVILATGYRTNVPSWLKEDEFFSKDDGYPRKPFPNGWKGKNGLYSVGFTKKGLLGASIDAQRVAEDIAQQWKSETKHFHLRV